MQRLLPLVLLLIAAGIGFAYIYPTFNGSIATEQQQITNYDGALKAAGDFQKKENDLITERNAIPPASLARLQEYLPDGVNNIQLILDMNALATRYGVALSGFSIQDNGAPASPGSPDATSTSDGGGSPSIQTTGVTDSLDLSVQATATYPAFQAFLTAAELSLRPLDITQISLTSTPTGVYTYAMTFRIYWLQ